MWKVWKKLTATQIVIICPCERRTNEIMLRHWRHMAQVEVNKDLQKYGNKYIFPRTLYIPCKERFQKILKQYFVLEINFCSTEIFLQWTIFLISETESSCFFFDSTGKVHCISNCFISGIKSCTHISPKVDRNFFEIN